MDLVTLFKNLPTDIQYLITNYYPKILFILPKADLIKYDWFKLIKMNFSLNYEREMSTNEEIMKVYSDNCTKSKIVCGDSHTIILIDGKIFGCGKNHCGQLGEGSVYAYAICRFREINGITKKIVEVACGINHTMIRLKDGTLMACGNNSCGQLGIGDLIEKWVFTEIKGIDKYVTHVACGDYHTIIRLIDGRLMSCGRNEQGQLGHGDERNRNMFTEIKESPRNIASVICGGFHSFILLTDGTLMSTGFNSAGALGLGDKLNRNTFTKIPGIPKNIAKVKCGTYHTIIRLTDGTLMASGKNASGELVLGDYIDRYVFTKIKMIKNIIDVTCGVFHTIVTLADGTLMSYGDNRYGQLGLGDKLDRNMFCKIKEPRKNIAEVSCGSYHTLIRLTDGTLMGCGNNYYGQLSLGFDINNHRDKFVEITCHILPKRFSFL
ncbi:MAG: chromosome condensation regulator [Hyperionvirus sp.]|uniref:Chromosome condensation regulator n=1 Tax=Hyperionvirus sp. TaxID=2487770 RepID=A0A3G5A5U6_9VIRU|nr:MAG: chromosome condensation regulator [Hyperionvirus sp.]